MSCPVFPEIQQLKCCQSNENDWKKQQTYLWYRSKLSISSTFKHGHEDFHFQVTPCVERLYLSSLTGCFAESIGISVLQPWHNLFRQHSPGDFHFLNVFLVPKCVYAPRSSQHQVRWPLSLWSTSFLKVMGVHVVAVGFYLNFKVESMVQYLWC